MTFNKQNTLIAILIIFCQICFGQHQSDLHIDRIYFSGNEKTETSFLHEIIAAEIGEKNSISTIDNDLEVLKNLASVADAFYEISEVDGKNILYFTITERSTKFPILKLGGIKNNLWFGIGFIENNLQGNASQFLAYYQNTDRRHTAEIFYKRPRTKSGKYGYTASLRKWSSLEPLFFNEGAVNYLYDNNAISISGIKNFDFRRNIQLGISLFQESYKQAEIQELANPPGPLDLTINKFLSKALYNNNQYKYSFFYLEGYSVNAIIQNVYNFDDGSFFNAGELEIKYFFKPKEKINIASRLKLGVSTNNNSPFAPFVADSHVNIRGIGNRIDRGTAQAVLNLEYRYTAYHKKEWACQWVAFSDFGTWRTPGGEFSDLVNNNNFRQFVGGGLRVIYQKVFGATFRIDYAVDIFNPVERGIVFGLGQYF